MPPTKAQPGLLGIEEALTSPPEQANLDGIAQHFAQLAGGQRGMAKMMYDEYLVAEPGSPIRARVFELVMRTFGKLEGTRGIEDLGVLSDEDIMRAAAGLIRKFANGTEPTGPAEDSRAKDPGPAAAESQVEGRPQEEGPAAATADEPAAPVDAAGTNPAAA